MPTSEHNALRRGLASLIAGRPVDTGDAHGLANNVNACCDYAARVVVASGATTPFPATQLSTSPTAPRGPVCVRYYYARVADGGAAYPLRVRVSASVSVGTLRIRVVAGDYDTLTSLRDEAIATLPTYATDITYTSPSPSWGTQSSSMLRLSPEDTARCLRRVPSRPTPTATWGECDVYEVWLALWLWVSTSAFVTIHALYAAEYVG